VLPFWGSLRNRFRAAKNPPRLGGVFIFNLTWVRPDAAPLDQTRPELVLRLDMIARELLELGQTSEAVRTLREALAGPIN